MILQVDPGGAVPPYEQLRGQISALAESGELGAGARLPTIRQLAGDLGLAPGTVARAYRELESEGVVISRRRHGTTVAPRTAPSARESERRLVEAARGYARAVASLDVGRDAAVAEFDRALAALTAEAD